MITRPLRDEHKKLLPEVDRLTDVADIVDSSSIDEVRRGVVKVEEFLLHHLIPHAQTEDRVLYPEVERLLGADGATATMRRDHEEVAALTAELSRLKSALEDNEIATELAAALRRVLYGLAAVVRLHFAKEEEVYLPLLDDGLSAAEGESLFSTMDRVAAEIKGK